MGNQVFLQVADDFSYPRRQKPAPSLYGSRGDLSIGGGEPKVSAGGTDPGGNYVHFVIIFEILNFYGQMTPHWISECKGFQMSQHFFTLDHFLNFECPPYRN